MIDGRQLAWVESPLQLLCAAEFAAAQGRSIDVAFRLSGPQMTATAKVLLDRGALFASCAPYYGIPWELLASHRDWVIGDAFSGQFRTAMSVLGARSMTLVDDGAMTVHAARVLTGRAPYSRPGQSESSLKTLLGGLARDRMLALAARERLDVFTAFADKGELRALAATGVAVRSNDFAWLRDSAAPISLTHDTVVLGSAAVVDGTLTVDAYLAWLRDTVRSTPAAYLPHRRESGELLERVRAVDGLTVISTGLPVELALAGTRRPLEIVTRPSTAVTTLERVLAGSGTRIRVDADRVTAERRVEAGELSELDESEMRR
ncbi:hypothetical protein BH11ACT3_BH11ACT3_01750 [soil metagenome]